jgi:hypothetical protein
MPTHGSGCTICAAFPSKRRRRRTPAFVRIDAPAFFRLTRRAQATEKDKSLSIIVNGRWCSGVRAVRDPTPQAKPATRKPQPE